MKNVILINPSCEIIDGIMEIEDVFLPVVAVQSQKDIEKSLSLYENRIGSILPYSEKYDDLYAAPPFDYNLTYDDIIYYKQVYVKTSKHALRLNRVFCDEEHIFYQALRFWLGIFENYKIDVLFLLWLEHGCYHESIPIEIAKKKGVQVYLRESQFTVREEKLAALFHLNNNHHININEIKKIRKKIDISYYVHNPNAITYGTYSNREGFKQLFLDKMTSVKKRIRYILSISFSTFFRRKFDPRMWEKTDEDYIDYVNSLKDFYQSIAIDTYDPGDKFIFYALHFEPEASILNRTTLSNQLFIIQILSENLPDGWKLLVKEHPQQFRLHGVFTPFVRRIMSFRTELFYSNIIRNKNTYLVNYDQKSERLIADSCAVATINGTVILEAIVKNKPILIFGDKSTILFMVKDVFRIRSVFDVKEAVTKIKNGYIPDYEDVESIISDYLVARSDFNKEFIKNMFKLMLNDAERV